MPIIATREDRRNEVGRRLWDLLRNVKRRCDSAKANLDDNRNHLVSAFGAASALVNFAGSVPVSDAQLSELLSDILGAGAFDAADYRALVDTELPALVTVCRDNGPALIAGDFQPAPGVGITLNASLPPPVRTAVSDALDAVIARFA